jgi:hypothetical protein
MSVLASLGVQPKIPSSIENVGEIGSKEMHFVADQYARHAGRSKHHHEPVA